jgi:hypothetical protein
LEVKAKFTIVERNVEHNIIFLHDNAYGHHMTITNDAESVVDYCRSLYGNRIRIVYKDTDNEWSEIKWSIGHSGTQVWFKPWYGLEWDILSRQYS